MEIVGCLIFFYCLGVMSNKANDALNALKETTGVVPKIRKDTIFYAYNCLLFIDSYLYWLAENGQ